MQAGSSIMPGKVNPVIPEVVNQVAFEVIGNDVTVTMAAEAGQLQLNAFEPIIAHSLFKSLDAPRRGCRDAGRALRRRASPPTSSSCARTASTTRSALVTALNPFIGYEAATALATEALESGRDIASLVVERGLLGADRLTELMRPENLTAPTRRT